MKNNILLYTRTLNHIHIDWSPNYKIAHQYLKQNLVICKSVLSSFCIQVWTIRKVKETFTNLWKMKYPDIPEWSALWQQNGFWPCISHFFLYVHIKLFCLGKIVLSTFMYVASSKGWLLAIVWTNSYGFLSKISKVVSSCLLW